MGVYRDVNNLDPGALVDLLVLDATAQGDGAIRYYHGGINELFTPVVWQGITYDAIPVWISGVEYSSQGVMPRPRLRVARLGTTFGAIVRSLNDLVGARITRKRTFVKYLDAVNFRAQENWITNSDALGSWTLSGCTVTDNQAINSEGALTLDKIVASVDNVRHYCARTPSRIFALGEQATLQCEMQYAGMRYGYLYQAGAAHSTQKGVYIDLLSGELGTLIGTPDSVSVVDKGEGRWLVTVTATTDVSGTILCGIGCTTKDADWIEPGDGTSGIYAGRAMLQTGATLLPYQAIGASFIRNATADPNAHFPDEHYYVARKVSENAAYIEFELTSSSDVAGVTLPRRQIIANACVWRYRSTECGYTGGPVAELDDTPTSDPDLDRCGKRLTSCKLRFGEYGVLPMGAFPAAGLVRY